ncbi:MAG: minor capsid protein [Candidatus Alectryocaccobium sp.]|jgi:SPP1 gp7 family putative phage head morphogenesis protein
MNSLNYWKRREEIAKQNYITEEAEYNRILAQLYNSMLVNIETQINSFYQKYAKAEKITMSEAMQKVSQMDVQAFQSKAKRYVQTRDFSKQANQELRLYNATMKINRLELLKANIGLEMIDAFNQMQGQFSTGLLKRAADEFERQAGILGMGVDDAPNLARTIVNASFHNADFSTRIWLYQGQLKNELSSLLSNGIVQGIHSRDLARQLERKFGVSKSNAERLMRTEMARVQIAAQEESYKANGYDQYVFLAIGTACPDCLAINGQHFYVADMQAGENAPPMHPNCRCSTAAWMDRAETMKQIKAMSRVKGVAKSMNTGKKVMYNPDKSYYIDIPEISENVKRIIADKARSVAIEGSQHGYEFAYLVDLDNGEYSNLLTDKEWGSVRPDYAFLKNHTNTIFIHNHNTDTELSFPDVSLLVNDPEINMVAAVRNDGIITLVKSNGKKTGKYLPLKYNDSGDYDRIMSELKGSKNLEIERELKLRDLAIDEYCEGGIQKYGYE